MSEWQNDISGGTEYCNYLGEVIWPGCLVGTGSGSLHHTRGGIQE